MTIEELNAEIQRRESQWNGLDQAPAVELMHLRRDRARELQRLAGCCGEQVRFEVDSSADGHVFERSVFTRCPYTGLQCVAAGRVPSYADLLAIVEQCQ